MQPTSYPQTSLWPLLLLVITFHHPVATLFKNVENFKPIVHYTMEAIENESLINAVSESYHADLIENGEGSWNSVNEGSWQKLNESDKALQLVLSGGSSVELKAGNEEPNCIFDINECPGNSVSYWVRVNRSAEQGLLEDQVVCPFLSFLPRPPPNDQPDAPPSSKDSKMEPEMFYFGHLTSYQNNSFAIEVEENGAINPIFKTDFILDYWHNVVITSKRGPDPDCPDCLKMDVFLNKTKVGNTFKIPLKKENLLEKNFYRLGGGETFCPVDMFFDEFKIWNRILSIDEIDRLFVDSISLTENGSQPNPDPSESDEKINDQLQSDQEDKPPPPQPKPTTTKLEDIKDKIPEAKNDVNEATEVVEQVLNITDNQELDTEQLGLAIDIFSELSNGKFLLDGSAMLSDKKQFREEYSLMASGILHRKQKGSLLNLYQNQNFNPGKLVSSVDNFLDTFQSDVDIDENFNIITENIDIHCVVANKSKDFNLTIEAKGFNYTSYININFPSSAFQKDLDVVKLIAASYSGLNDVLISSEENSTSFLELASPVVSIVAQTINTTFEEDVVISIPIDSETEGLEFSCQWIANITNSTDWSDVGCSTEIVDEKTIMCSCNHLTNFAVLVSFTDEEFSEELYLGIEIITYVGSAISLFSLFLTIVILLWLKKELDSSRYLIVRNLVAALFSAQLLFVTAVTNATPDEVLCSTVAGFLHYFWLCVFFWMLSHGIHLYIKIQRNLCTSFKDFYFYIIGWGTPVIIVGITAGVNSSGYGTESSCWLSVEDYTILAFAVPAIITILINTIILIIVIKVFMGIKTMKNKSEQERFRGGLKAAIILMPVLGLTWLFGFLSFNKQTLIFQYFFAILNSLQGFFIFIFHVVINEEVKKIIIMKQRKSDSTETSVFGLFKMFKINVVEPSEKSEKILATASTALDGSNRS